VIGILLHSAARPQQRIALLIGNRRYTTNIGKLARRSMTGSGTNTHPYQ
jgi:hypothetical protein